MIKVESRRFRRLGLSCAVASLAVWGGSANAQVVNTKVVPADSAYVISVPDSVAFWSAWESNGIYEIYKNIMDMPEVEKNLANFRKELGIVESSLGFKLDGDTLSKVFTSAEIFIAVGSDAKEPDFVLISKVADEDKLSKLIDLSEKAALEAAADDDDDDTTGTKSSDNDDDDDDDDKPVILESEHNGFKIKQFKPEADEDKDGFVYSRGEGYFLFASSLRTVKQTIDQLKAADVPANSLVNDESYKKIAAALQANKGQVYVYTNQTRAAEFEAKLSKLSDDDDDDDDDLDKSREMQAAANKFVQGFIPVTATGASLTFESKQISSYSYGLMKKELTSDSIFLQHPGNEPIQALGLIPESAIMVGATSLVNAEGIYEFATGIAKTVSDSSKKAGDDDDDIEDIDEGLEEAAEEISKAEKKVGLSVKDDVIPAIGNEIAFSINDIRFTGFIPTVDVTLIVGVRDKAKMEKVTTQLEKLGQEALDKKNETGGAADKTTIETADVNGSSIKYLKANGLFGFSPGYVLTDDYLVVGSTKNTLEAALKNPEGQNLLKGDALTKLGSGYSANANVVQYMNFAKVNEIALQVTSSLPNTKEAVKYVEELDSLDTAASVTRVEDGALVTRSVLKTK